MLTQLSTLKKRLGLELFDPTIDRPPIQLVCQFDIPKNTLSVGETKAVLDGQTFQGDPIHSSHFIEVH